MAQRGRSDRSNVVENQDISTCPFSSIGAHQRSYAVNNQVKTVEQTNWKWQASDGEDNTDITSTWSCQWSEATRRCLYHEGHINPSSFSIKIRQRAKGGNLRYAVLTFLTHSHFPVYIIHTRTPGEFNHILPKIQLCVMTSSGIDWAYALFSSKLIWFNRLANTSQVQRARKDYGAIPRRFERWKIK